MHMLPTVTHLHMPMARITCTRMYMRNWIVPVLCIAHANWVMDDGLLPGTVFSMVPITPHHAAGIADDLWALRRREELPELFIWRLEEKKQRSKRRSGGSGSERHVP